MQTSGRGSSEKAMIIIPAVVLLFVMVVGDWWTRTVHPIPEQRAPRGLEWHSGDDE